jgi:putative copper resistance protein D
VPLPPAVVPLLAVLAGVVASAIAAHSTGAMDPLVFVADAGPLVRWSVPLVRVAHDVAAAMTFAALVFAASLVPAEAASSRARAGLSRSPAPSRAMRVAAVAGLVWAVTALLGVVLTFADAAGLQLSNPALTQQFGALVWQIDSTRIGLISAACAIVVTTCAVVARGRTMAAWLAAVAGFGVVVLGLANHTGTSDEHETSVDAMGLHLAGAMMWVGGLLTLIVLHRVFARRLAVIATRFSTLALWSFVTVGISGVLAATTRLVTWSDLGTAYGLLIVVKTAAFVTLGVAGWWHRRSTLSDLQAGISGRPFYRLAVGEAIVMGATFGVATALSRSAPPEPEDLPDPTPTLAITGFPAPPPPSVASLWTAWRVDWLFLAVALLAIGLYAAGLVNARVLAARSLMASHADAAARRESRGATAPPTARDSAALLDRPWPAWRALLWVLGWLGFGWAMCGAIGIYSRVSVSWHLALQVVLAFVVALLLVLGAPVDLARRALVPRTDGTLGPRELVLGVADSRVMRALRRPWVATLLLVGGMLAFHATGLLDLALTTHPGHLVMVVVTLAVGALWSSAVIGAIGARGAADERTVRVRREALTCVVIVVVVAFAAALWLGRTTSLLAGDIFRQLALGWETDLAADQERAGAVALFVVVPVCVALGVGLVAATHRARDAGRHEEAERHTA